MFRELMKGMNSALKDARKNNSSSNKARSWDDWEKLWEEERLFKKKHPFKHYYRKLKWYCTGYWVEVYDNFKNHFEDHQTNNGERPWYKSLWMYLYLDNNIFSFFYKIYSYIGGFFYELKRLNDWRKIIWRNYDWDYGFFWTIMQRKLERMEEAIGSGSTGNRKIHAAEIQYTLILLDKIQRYEHYGDCPYEAQAQIDVKSKDRMDTYARAYELYVEDCKIMFNYMSDAHRGWWD